MSNISRFTHTDNEIKSFKSKSWNIFTYSVYFESRKELNYNRFVDPNILGASRLVHSDLRIYRISFFLLDISPLSVVMFFYTSRLTCFIMFLGHDTHVVVQWELITLEHLWPGISVLGHAAFTSPFDGFTEGSARPDMSGEADWREERAQEQLGILVTLKPLQGHPGSGLLLHLFHRVVLQ